MKGLENIKDNKVTTGTGVAMLLILALKAFKIDLGEVLGADTSTIALSVGSVISSILLLFAKDPRDGNIQKQNGKGV